MMFDWLFNGIEMVDATRNLIITAGIIAIVFLVLWILYKTKVFPAFTKTFFSVIAFCLGVCVILSGVYSYVYINAYYKKDGGVYGKLENVIYGSIKEVQSEDKNTITYSFDNLVFKSDENEEYSIVFIQDYQDEDYRTRFLEGTNYSIFVYNNGEKYECNNIKYDTEWIIAEYSYVFYKSYDEGDVIADDTLHFDFCFYENYSYLKITSDADYTTIQLWDAYFNKYNFEVVIEVVEDIYIPEDFSETVVDGIIQIEYIVDQALPSTREIYSVIDSSGAAIELETNYSYGDYYIKGWKNKNGDTVTSISRNVSSNIKLYAVAYNTTELHEVNFYNLDGSEIIETQYYLYGETIDYEVTPVSIGLSESGKIYSFYGWYTSKISPVWINNPEGISYPIAPTIEVVDSAMNLYPVFTYRTVVSYA